MTDTDKSITVVHSKAMRFQLERDIERLIDAFQRQTGLEVESVNTSYLYHMTREENMRRGWVGVKVVMP